LERNELCAIIEAVLFVAGEPVERAAMRDALEITDQELEEALEALTEAYESGRRGIRLLRFGDRAQLATRPDYAPYVERLLQPIQKQSLSQAALETLAVVAYKQPVTRSEIEAIRGVKCDYSVQSLVQKRLIQEVGRKDALGRPILYGTTDEFLRHFCIASLEELPEIDLSVPPSPEGEADGETPTVQQLMAQSAEVILAEQQEPTTDWPEAETQGED
jgi:segregation and condensation protein B